MLLRLLGLSAPTAIVKAVDVPLSEMTTLSTNTNIETSTQMTNRTPTEWGVYHLYVRRCLQIIANALIEANWALYSDADHTHQLTRSPALDALNNPLKIDADNFIRAMVEWLLLHGNCYIYNAGTDTKPELYILPGDRERVKVMPNKQGWPDHYELTVNPTSLSSQKKVIHYGLDEITHLKLFSISSSLYGVGIIEGLREGLITNGLSVKTRRNFWTNDATPAGILSTDKDVDDTEATRQVKRWVKLFRGPDKAGKIAYLGGGTKYQAVAVPPKDMQWLEQHDVDAKDVCAAFGVPLVLIDGMSANRATAQESTRTLWTITVLPFGGGICTGLSRAPWCNGYLDLDTSRVDALKADVVVERDGATKILAGGLVSLNRAREMIGEPTLGTQGDVFYVPSNVVVTPLAQLGVTPDAVPAPNDGSTPPKAYGDQSGAGDSHYAAIEADRAADSGADRGDTPSTPRAIDSEQRGLPEPVDPSLGAKPAAKLKRQLKRDFQAQMDAALGYIRAGGNGAADVLPKHDPASFVGHLRAMVEAGFPSLTSDHDGDDPDKLAAWRAAYEDADTWATERAVLLAGDLMDTTRENMATLAAQATDEALTDREYQDAVTDLFRGYQGRRVDTIVRSERAAALACAKEQPA